MSKLDPTKQQIMEHIVNGITENGCVPTVRELSALMKFSSPSGVVNHLKIMVRDGHLLHIKTASRGYIPIEFMRRMREALRVVKGLATDELEKKEPI